MDEADKAMVEATGRKTDKQEPCQEFLDDPEIMHWLQKKGKNSEGSGHEESMMQAILEDPEMQQWILARKKEHKGGDATMESILDDPETNDWLVKRATRETKLGRNAHEFENTKKKSSTRILPYLEDTAPDGSSLLLQNQAREGALGAPQCLTRQQHVAAPENQPGAYLGAPGGELQRRDYVHFSHVGVHPDDEALAPVDGFQGLAEAMPVEDHPVDMEAQPVDLTSAARRLPEANKSTKRKLLFGIAMFLLVLVGAIVLVTVLRKQDKKAGSVPLPTLPTPTPSASHPEYPSFAPSGVWDELMEDLPNGTLVSLESISTPQWKALNWLEHHNDLWNMTESRKKQLFSLATFFYSMGGESWPEVIKRRWLQYEKEECFWFSGTFGAIGEDGEYEEEESYIEVGMDDPCNNQTEFQTLILFNLDLQKVLMPPEITLLTSLSAISLPLNSINASFTEFLPGSFHQLTSLTFLNFHGNFLTGSIPSELALVKSITELDLGKNALTGAVPTQLGLMTSMTRLYLDQNSLTGPVPSELGIMASVTRLWLDYNSLSGSIPRELGLMTNMAQLYLGRNNLTGSIPSELGRMTGIERLFLRANNLFGTIPLEVGGMTNLRQLSLHTNSLSGALLSELGLLTNLDILALENNFLTGSVPTELGDLAINGPLLKLTLANNSLSGSIPEALCSLGLSGLSFDCGDKLCGCCWCPCPESNYTGECQTHPFQPAENDKEWSGSNPSELNAITINIRTDYYPEETSFDWSVQDESGLWQLLDTQKTIYSDSVHSYQQLVDPDSLYRLRLYDEYSDGTCCSYGSGWFTIVSSAFTSNHSEGSVIWEATGDTLESFLEVYISIDASGHAQIVTQVLAEEHGLIHGDLMEGDNMTLALIPHTVTGNSTIAAATSPGETDGMMG